VYIYLIRDIDKDCYKIGKTKKSVTSRLKQLQTGNSTKLEVVAYYESAHYSKIEAALHSIYSYKRIGGEWFMLDYSEIDNFTSKCKQIDDGIKQLIEQGNIYLL
jgi:hypothetical protein